jgi:PIN domain
VPYDCPPFGRAARPLLMLHLFIDTGVYLTFFAFAQDELDELQKLEVAIRNSEVRLWVTEQVIDEYARNREGKIAESLAGLRKMKLPDAFPQIARNYAEFDALQEAKKEFGKHLNAINERLAREVEERSLAADKLIEGLLALGERIDVTDAELNAARRRVDVGNPPGKKGELGDAINWECLLAKGPDGADLHFFSVDSDYASKLNPDRIAPFLADEWTDRKGGSIHLHRLLSSFFRDNFPDIELAVDLENEIRVRRLINSGSFQTTHDAIAAMPQVESLSEQQVRALLEAARWNSQINWIANDPDVRDFYQRLLDTHSDILTEHELARFHEDFG